MSYGKLLILNGTTLTDLGRDISVNRDERATVVELANGSLKKYVKSEKYKFDITWNWLPGSAALTTDGGGGRNLLKSIEHDLSNQYLPFTITDPELGILAYTVIIDGYSEELLRRDINLGTSFWNVKLSLREV